METKVMINIVATQCQPADEKKFNQWYNEVHVPLLMKFKGMTKVSRYEMTGDVKDFPKYLAVYEFESQKALEAFNNSPELAAALKEMNETWKGGIDIKWMVQLKLLQTWIK